MTWSFLTTQVLWHAVTTAGILPAVVEGIEDVVAAVNYVAGGVQAAEAVGHEVSAAKKQVRAIRAKATSMYHGLVGQGAGKRVTKRGHVLIRTPPRLSRRRVEPSAWVGPVYQVLRPPPSVHPFAQAAAQAGRYRTSARTTLFEQNLRDIERSRRKFSKGYHLGRAEARRQGYPMPKRFRVKNFSAIRGVRPYKRGRVARLARVSAGLGGRSGFGPSPGRKELKYQMYPTNQAHFSTWEPIQAGTAHFQHRLFPVASGTGTDKRDGNVIQAVGFTYRMRFGPPIHDVAKRAFEYRVQLVFTTVLTGTPGQPSSVHWGTTSGTDHTTQEQCWRNPRIRPHFKILFDRTYRWKYKPIAPKADCADLLWLGNDGAYLADSFHAVPTTASGVGSAADDKVGYSMLPHIIDIKKSWKQRIRFTGPNTGDWDDRDMGLFIFVTSNYNHGTPANNATISYQTLELWHDV